ncbi:MAG: 3'-5' exonuclease [Candidatus Limivicinus sp.]|nr:3'-5' exonuclease [Candidatus Limivicinus sp.]
MLESLFERFDNIIVLDTETTGFSPRREEIIELAMLRVSRGGETQEYDNFIRLSPGRSIPPKIVELTGITDAMLEGEGVSKEEACADLAEMLSLERPLVVAYNAQFDLGFLYYFLHGFGKAGVLKNVHMLDALTVYRDRRPFPHKLCNAVEAYSLVSQNTHRAIDDTKATYELLCAMDAEEPDLHRYINLFGYSEKYGVSGQRISSVTYRPQGYENKTKLYLR